MLLDRACAIVARDLPRPSGRATSPTGRTRPPAPSCADGAADPEDGVGEGTVGAVRPASPGLASEHAHRGPRTAGRPDGRPCPLPVPGRRNAAPGGARRRCAGRREHRLPRRDALGRRPTGLGAQVAAGPVARLRSSLEPDRPRARPGSTSCAGAPATPWRSTAASSMRSAWATSPRAAMRSSPPVGPRRPPNSSACAVGLWRGEPYAHWPRRPSPRRSGAGWPRSGPAPRPGSWRRSSSSAVTPTSSRSWSGWSPRSRCGRTGGGCCCSPSTAPAGRAMPWLPAAAPVPCSPRSSVRSPGRRSADGGRDPGAGPGARAPPTAHRNWSVRRRPRRTAPARTRAWPPTSRKTRPSSTAGGASSRAWSPSRRRDRPGRLRVERRGQSSAVRAGLVPALAAGALPGSRAWQTVIVTPGRAPVDALASLTGDTPPAGPVLLVCDQFEELWAPGVDPAERTAFLDAVLGLIDDGIVVRSSLSCAATTWGGLRSTRPLPSGSAAPWSRPCADRRELREVVREPAAAAGLTADPELLEAVVADVLGRPGPCRCCRRRWWAPGSAAGRPAHPRRLSGGRRRRGCARPARRRTPTATWTSRDGSWPAACSCASPTSTTAGRSCGGRPLAELDLDGEGGGARGRWWRPSSGVASFRGRGPARGGARGAAHRVAPTGPVAGGRRGGRAVRRHLVRPSAVSEAGCTPTRALPGARLARHWTGPPAKRTT